MIAVRKAVESDLPEVIRLQHQLDLEEPRLSEDDAKRIFAKMNAYPDYGVFIAEMDGVAVGTFTLLVMDKLGHNGRRAGIVEDVVVDETKRGEGIGREMMQFAMDYCRERGCYKLALTSNVKRTAAHDFYEGIGFERHGFSYRIDL